MTSSGSVRTTPRKPLGELAAGGSPLAGPRSAQLLTTLIAEEGAALRARPVAGPREDASGERLRLAETLLWVRTCAGLSRREMAVLIGWADERSLEQRLWRYESGRAAVPFDVLRRVAEVLSLSIEVFAAARAGDALAHTRLRRRRASGRRAGASRD